jgi:hypothetical protein
MMTEIRVGQNHQMMGSKSSARLLGVHSIQDCEHLPLEPLEDLLEGWLIVTDDRPPEPDEITDESPVTSGGCRWWEDRLPKNNFVQDQGERGHVSRLRVFGVGRNIMDSGPRRPVFGLWDE